MFKNSEGYPDPTAGKAITDADATPKDVSELVKAFKSISGLAGYEITNRIWFKDKSTGREWR